MTAADGQYETIASGCFYGHAGSKTMVARDLNRWLERNKHLAQASREASATDHHPALTPRRAAHAGAQHTRSRVQSA